MTIQTETIPTVRLGREYAAIQHVVRKERSRHCINGIHAMPVHPSGEESIPRLALTATDGHVAIRIMVDFIEPLEHGAYFAERILSVDAWKAACKNGARLRFDEDAATVLDGKGNELSFRYLEGEFPDAESCVPKVEGDQPVGAFNAEQLARLQAAAGADAVHGLTHTRKGMPIQVHFVAPKRDVAFAIAMPVDVTQPRTT